MTGSTGRFIAQKSPGRPRKIDWQELEPDIPANPSQLLRKPAHQLGVWPNAIRYACRQMKTTDKKLRYQKWDHGSGLGFLQKMRNLIKEDSSADICRY